MGKQEVFGNFATAPDERGSGHQRQHARRFSLMRIALPGALLATLVLAGSSLAALGDVERVSVSSAGVEGNDSSSSPSLSADGRYVAFASNASNLVPGDTSRFRVGGNDIFVYDRTDDTIERVSVASDESEADNASYAPSISPDGGYVAFDSRASNLPGDRRDGSRQVYVRDLAAGTTEAVFPAWWLRLALHLRRWRLCRVRFVGACGGPRP